MDHNDSSHISEVVNRTLVPLLVNYMPAVVTALVAWITLIQIYFGKRDEAALTDENEAPEQKIDRKPIVASVNKTAKKKQHSEKWSRDPKQNYSHEWLLDPNDAILNMEFSANGKFLATCADDDPGGTSGSSSSSEANKENNSPGRLTRRQKKNRVRKEDTSPLKKKVKRDMRKKGRHEDPYPLKQYIKLNLNDTDVFYTLRNYTLSAEDMMTLGYPVESKLYPGRAMIYRAGALDANAKEFVPRDESVYTSLLVQNSDQFGKRQEFHIKRNNGITSEEKKCVRCNKGFFMSSDGEYLTQEHCNYHWGKLHSPPSGGIEWFYSCCKGRQGTKGCTTAKLHVWSGVEPGRNGPFDGYVRTRQRKTPPQDGNYGVYSLDCEMCFTNTGLELTKISVVSLDGKPVYETFVRPESFIIDYNTRFSGITAKDMSRNSKVKTLKDVQNDLMGFITADTILVGHGLENDLRALRMIHYTVVDTAVVFPHILGLPYKRSLKSLTHSYLRKDIQVGTHDSYEDACSCLELILWKLRKDLLRNNDK
ncbi:unnamed protein product [Nezara viridula]|uniref:Exonuclease domain-containing protein n=1 Tax=Nezara viridula TaxID=85310 RepID=A0A9P0HJW4_NEZVI|nr:unnamed protein product [Nezara viridula]